MKQSAWPSLAWQRSSQGPAMADPSHGQVVVGRIDEWIDSDNLFIAWSIYIIKTGILFSAAFEYFLLILWSVPKLRQNYFLQIALVD